MEGHPYWTLMQTFQVVQRVVRPDSSPAPPLGILEHDGEHSVSHAHSTLELEKQSSLRKSISGALHQEIPLLQRS